MGDTSNALAAAPALDADAAAAGEVQTDGTGEQDRKLFLGGLSWETTDQKLRDHFGQYGTMTDVVIMTDKVTGRSRGFGFVTFSTKQSAEDALAGSHNIDGKQVEAKRSQSREAMGGGGPAGSDRKIKKVFVGGLAPETTEEEFRECFEKCGPVMETLIMKDGTTGKPRGFGFVTFESEAGAAECTKVDRHRLCGRDVQVKLAVPKEQMGPGQRGGRQMGGMRGGPMRGGYDHGGYGGGGYGGGYGGGGYGGGGYGYGGGYGGGYGPPQGGYGGYGGPPQGGYGGYDYGPPQGGGYGGGYGPPQGGGYGDYGAPPAGGAPAHGGYDQAGYGQPPAQQWQGGGGYGGYEGGGYGQGPPAAADGGYGMKGAAPDRYRPY